MPWGWPALAVRQQVQGVLPSPFWSAVALVDLGGHAAANFEVFFGVFSWVMGGFLGRDPMDGWIIFRENP